MESKPSAKPKNHRRQQCPLIPVTERPIKRLSPTDFSVKRSRREIHLRGKEESKHRRGQQDHPTVPQPDQLWALASRRVQMDRSAHTGTVTQRLGLVKPGLQHATSTPAL